MEKITSKDNAVIKEISALNNSSKARRENGKFVVEGFRLCMEAALSGWNILTTVVSEECADKYSELIMELEKKSKRTVIVQRKLFDRLADTKNPQGIMCICPLPNDTELKLMPSGKYILLENISDPSNMGTIIRTADALGISGIIISKDSCDIFSPKVVRGSMGAIFRMPIVNVENVQEYIKMLNTAGFSTYASVVRNDAEKITDLSLEGGSVVVIGNEGNGITKDTEEACLKSITIPMKGRAESLNAAVAASIIMWEIMR